MTEIGTGIYRQSGKPANKYFVYAVKRLLSSGFKLNSTGRSFLARLIQKSATRAGLRRIAKSSGRTVHISTERYYRSIDRLIESIILVKRELGKNTQIITHSDIQLGLRRLCPLWPFC